MYPNFRTYHLAVEFYRATVSLVLPRHLREQLLRASSSIALNLSEGAGRSSKAQQRYFFGVAFGSLRESQSILELSPDANTNAFEQARDKADILAAHLYRLIKRTN